jgi:hypothetical protein
MTAKTESIEVDSDTALKTLAAERGISVSALVAELVPFAIDDAGVAELDRRGAAIEAGQPTVPHGAFRAFAHPVVKENSP